MLLYVLPFILLLVIALILKKREANKEAEPAKKAAPAKSKAQTSSSISSEPVAQPKQSGLVANQRSPLAPELRRHIENQMRDGNYFAAEAQINQALNRDNGQHELYLMLLDLHLLQNDEFAINQLFTHLRALQLDDILADAQAKLDAHEQKLAQEAKAKAEAQAAQLAANSVSFDQLQEQVTPAKTQAPLEFKPAEAVEPQVEVKAPVAPQPEAQEQKPLEFSFSQPQKAAQPAQPLEFSHAPTAATQSKTEEKSLDFAFNLDQPSAATAAQEQAPPADNSLEFSFSPNQAPKSPELEFNLDAAPAPSSKATDFNLADAAAAKAPAGNELEFNLDQPATAKPKLEFSLDPATAPQTPAQPEAAERKLNPQDFEFKTEVPAATTASQAEIPAQPSVEANDPLLQLFPALGQINEADLNLRLAAEYIRLGAYDSAKTLLAEQDTSYNEQQRQIANTLRNKIA